MTWMRIAEASKALGIAPSSVRERAQRGAVVTRKIPGRGPGGFIAEYDVADVVTGPEAPAWSTWTDPVAALREAAKPARETPAPSTTSDTVWSVTGIFDVHVPEQDIRTWRAWLRWCRDRRPDEVIIGGDFLEMESGSQHGGVARPAALIDEIDAGKRALDEIREANPDAVITYLEGNHETRIPRIIANALPTFAGAVTVDGLLDLKSRGIKFHPYGEVVKRGKIGFTHGHWCNLHHAKKHLDEFGCSIAYGHTHKPQVFTKATADGKVHGAFGMPCMRTCDPAWMAAHGPSGWLCGFGVFYVMPSGLFTPYMVLANDGSFVWDGTIYRGDA